MEYFIVANSFAAPFCSDTSTGFVDEATPEAALEFFVATYSHPAGLFSAAVFADANAREKGEDPLARWLCNHEIAKEKASKGKGSYVYCGKGPGQFEIDGKLITVDDPKGGRIVS